MLFGCPLPEELDGSSIGQRAVATAFETILSSAAVQDGQSLNGVIYGAYQQRNDVKLVKTGPHPIVAHLTIHRQHSNWNHYGIRLRQTVVQELLIT